MKNKSLFRVLGLLGLLAAAQPGRAQPAPATLQEAAAAKGVVYGVAASVGELQNAPYAAAVGREAELLVASGDLLMAYMRPTPTTYDFTKGDQMVQFARAHGQRFYGTHLVWHGSLPAHWFPQYVTAANARQVLTDHISTVAGHYRGQMYGWSVVNEAVDVDETTNQAHLRDTPWLRFLGPDYIELAFRTARAADPNALLVYNDYGVEDDYYPPNVVKRARVLQLLRDLKAKGVPIDALGVQAHIWAGNRFSLNSGYRQFLRDVAALGLKILITELDVAEGGYTPSPAGRDQDIAEAYRTYLEVVLDEPAVVSVATWGLSDKYSWYANSRPLPLDSSLNKKPAYYAVLNAFANSTQPHFHGVYTLAARHSGQRLDVRGAGLGDTVGVLQWPATGGANQQWRVERAGSAYRLTALHSGKCLDVSGSSPNDGAKVQQYADNGTAAQRWQVAPTTGGYCKLLSQASGKALDVAGGPGATQNGARVQQWTYVGNANQQWRLVPVVGAPVVARLARASVAAAPAAALALYPNPSPDGRATAVLTTAQAQPATVQVRDGFGKLVAAFAVAARAGQTECQLPAALGQGTYFVSARLDGKTQRFVLKVE